MSDVFDGYEAYSAPNWDGYQAAPITAETLRLSKVIAALLEHKPDIAPGADGTIGFEWCSPANDCKVFMDVSESGVSFYVRVGEKSLPIIK